MRSEKEMMELIISVARSNERIRAVYMNGSRTNPNAPKDKYMDYDIVYVVSEMEWFHKNHDWISVFGETLMIQEPDKNDIACGADLDINLSYSWMMLLHDGNRIDLTIEPTPALDNFGENKLTVILLDKDNMLPKTLPPSDAAFLIQKPTEGQYYDATNNFWWCLQNVVKGIMRDELTYAMNMYIQVVHEKLESMIKWYIGIDNDFSVNVGSWGKWYKKYLPENLYDMYVKTYSDASYENLWNAVFVACDLFRTIAPFVGEALGYTYKKHEEVNILGYLARIRNGE